MRDLLKLQMKYELSLMLICLILRDLLQRDF